MPELPEVERAKELLKSICQGRIIENVETSEDTIVYSGVSHTDFAAEIKGRKVLDVVRYGKVFYIVLEGDGRMPVMHFGMTGMIQVKGDEPTRYRKRPKDAEDQWPPKWMKFILHFAATDDRPAAQVAFRDARRLGRIRLCAKPQEEPPISELGFDPLLSMPPIEDFTLMVKKRNVPIKALLLDQAFSAGVGNWVADEILFQSGMHPEERANSLDESQIATLHEKMVHVCQTAVDVHADSSKFPTSWLFPHRWEKGKKQKDQPSPLILPDGETARIKWITVGGRTSAVVEQVQKLSSGSISGKKQRSRKKKAKKSEDEDEADSSELSDAASDTGPAKSPATKARRVKRKTVSDDDDDYDAKVATTSQGPKASGSKRAKRKV